MNETLILSTPKFASGPGVFTVITGDMWGDGEVAHFTVSPWGGASNVYPGASVYSSNGLRLTLWSNSTELVVGQGLNVTLSIDNTLGSINSVKPSNDWLVHGVPVALWPGCYFGLPAQAAVLPGNFTTQDISSAANVTFGYGCAEGVEVDHVIFQPNSDQVNLTGLYDVTSTNQTLGPFNLSLGFTTRGFWDLQNLSRQINIPILGDQYPPRPPASVPFAPGVYTVAVADEWGQVALIHVTVVPSSEAFTVNGLTCPVPTGYTSNIAVADLLPKVDADPGFLKLTQGQPFVFGNAENITNRVQQIGNQPPVHLPDALEMVFYGQGSATSCSMYRSDATSTIVVDVPIIDGNYNMTYATFNVIP